MLHKNKLIDHIPLISIILNLIFFTHFLRLVMTPLPTITCFLGACILSFVVFMATAGAGKHSKNLYIMNVGVVSFFLVLWIIPHDYIFYIAKWIISQLLRLLSVIKKKTKASSGSTEKASPSVGFLASSPGDRSEVDFQHEQHIRDAETRLRTAEISEANAKRERNSANKLVRLITTGQSREHLRPATEALDLAMSSFAQASHELHDAREDLNFLRSTHPSATKRARRSWRD
jgi:hypothetical protein